MGSVAPRKIQSQEDFPQSGLAYLNDHVPIEQVFTALTSLPVDQHWAKCLLAANHQSDDGDTLRFHANRGECVGDHCDASFSVLDMVQTVHDCDLHAAVQWVRQKWPGPMPVEDDDDDLVAADAPRPLIPPGIYDAQCTRAERRHFMIFHRDVIVLTFRITEAGPYMGVILERFLHRPEDGKIRCGSHYYREWVVANSDELPHRRDKMARRKFVGKIFRVQVVTVSTDRNQANLGGASYSKVSRLLALVATNEAVQWP